MDPSTEFEFHWVWATQSKLKKACSRWYYRSVERCRKPACLQVTMHTYSSIPSSSLSTGLPRRSQHLGPSDIYLDDLPSLDSENAALYFPQRCGVPRGGTGVGSGRTGPLLLFIFSLIPLLSVTVGWGPGGGVSLAASSL